MNIFDNTITGNRLGGTWLLRSLFLVLVLSLPFCSLTWAQKNEITQARSLIKTGKEKELGQAENLMVNLLKKPENRSNERIYLTWYDAVRGLYGLANERLYLKQNQDTATFFNLNLRMFTILEALDSLDMQPDKKGRVELEHRQKNAALLDNYRKNLFAAGTYYLRKSDYKQAFRFFEKYIDCATQPLFSGYRYDSTDVRMPEAAYWATFSAYRQQDPVLTLRHRQLALRDSSKVQYTLRYMAEARNWLHDEELYTKTLEEGFRRFPQSTYFFPRLMDAYTSDGRLDLALAACDSALAVCDSCDVFLFAKSTTLLHLGRYTESIEVSKRLLQFNDTMPEPYFNIGTAYVNIALELDPLTDKQQLNKLFEQARPYMERYRALMPDEKKKWGPVLYRIYLNLNMGRQFDEIDRLLNK